jgi:hypothetical protein
LARLEAELTREAQQRSQDLQDVPLIEQKSWPLIEIAPALVWRASRTAIATMGALLEETIGRGAGDGRGEFRLVIVTTSEAE